MLSPRNLLLFAVSLALLAGVACGGDDDDSSSVHSDVTCAPLKTLTYRYTAESSTEVKASLAPVASPVGLLPFKTVVKVQADVQGARRTAGIQSLGDGVDFQDTHIVAIENKAWVLLGAQWYEQPLSAELPPIAYSAYEDCTAIAPDLALAGLSSTSEDVNGIASRHFTLDVSGDFFARHSAYGPANDLSNLVQTLAVDVWVAEDGNYPTKLQIDGETEYPDGRPLIGQLSYEVSDVNSSDIEITPPPSATSVG